MKPNMTELRIGQIVSWKTKYATILEISIKANPFIYVKFNVDVDGVNVTFHEEILLNYEPHLKHFKLL